MYSTSKLMFIRALTPVHVGIGRAEKLHVDLPIQRDEFGFPTIWASSLKGAIKANLSNNVRKYLGSEPGEVPTTPSTISILDARLLFIPVRVLNGVWCYATTPMLMETLNNYLSAAPQRRGAQINVGILPSIMGSAAAVTNRSDLVENNRIVVNETTLDATVRDNLVDELGLRNILPKEILDTINHRGLVVITDRNNLGLSIINKSMLIQYRVRLSRKTKTVEEGPWSEEYVPMETVFVSLALCRDFGDKKASDVCNDFANDIGNKIIYIGGKETIGRGLVKIYIV